MTSSEVDEALQHFTTSLRTSLAAASQIAERQARLREQRSRNATSKSEQERRELYARLISQQKSAEASLNRVYRREWWEGADPAKVATAYRVAAEWQERSPAAGMARQHMDEQIKQRYGIAPAEVHAVRRDIQGLLRDAGAKRNEASLQERQSNTEKVTAVYQQAEAEDRAVQANDRSAENADLAADGGEGIHTDVHCKQDGEPMYDSAERRDQLRAHLEGQGLDDETTAARLSADLDQATPPAAAVSAGGPKRAPKSRKTKLRRNRGRQHDQGR